MNKHNFTIAKYPIHTAGVGAFWGWIWGCFFGSAFLFIPRLETFNRPGTMIIRTRSSRSQRPWPLETWRE
jgi:hypothetical protein